MHNVNQERELDHQKQWDTRKQFYRNIETAIQTKHLQKNSYKHKLILEVPISSSKDLITASIPFGEYILKWIGTGDICFVFPVILSVSS